MTQHPMEEPVGDENFGQAASPDPQNGGRHQPLAVSEMQALDIIREGGMGFVVPSAGSTSGKVYGARDAGMTAHRGVLTGEEYIDQEDLREAVEASLGFTYADVAEAYAKGRPTAGQRQLRDRIDSRLLALSRERGNMSVLADVLDISEKTIDRALARARTAEVKPIVARPAVRTRHVSFLTGEEGATPRRRRHVGCPGHMLPEEQRRYSTINLTDEEYARGLEDRPGNPRYWEHRLATTPIRNGVAPGPPRRKQTFPADWPSDESYAAFVERG